MKALALSLALLSGCAPMYASATRKCPPIIATLGDFVIGTAGLAVSTLKWNVGKHGESLAYSTGSMILFVSSGMAEVRTCKR